MGHDPAPQEAPIPYRLITRVMLGLLIGSILLWLWCIGRAFAESVAVPTTSFWIAFIAQLPAIFVAVTGLITSVGVIYSVYLNRKIHEKTNSLYDRAQAETRDEKRISSGLREVIAAKPDATSEEKVRAIVAKEQLGATPTLPPDKKP